MNGMNGSWFSVAGSRGWPVPASWLMTGVEVTLVDRNDYHQFQPLLYQVASSQLPAEDIARPHRTIFKDHPSVDVVTAQVTDADLSARSSHARRRQDVARVAPGDGGGCTAELLRSARRRRARLSAVLGG